MYLNRLAASLGYLLCRRQRPVFCRAHVHIFIRSMAVVAAIMSARMVLAGVAQTGDVFPADNPFTFDVDEGIPDGNTVKIFEAPNHQTFFEGRHTDGADLANPLDDTNVNFDITVGKTSYGTLFISGESVLRDQNLTIGDKGTIGSQTRLGTGVVRISGFASTYNNDPDILPAEVQGVAGFSSVNPRPKTVGFDVYVGKWGTGTLEINGGGRAEIQDAILVGDNVGAVGYAVVDGIDSFLTNGGADFGQASAADPHGTIIGRQGTGYLTVSTGATMMTQVTATTGNSQQGTVGASLGSSPYTITSSSGGVLTSGGDGTATITGAGSKWTIGGSLQIGGFDIGVGSGGVFSSGGDLEGDNTAYGSQAGRGTLYVNGGGLVEVQTPAGTPSGGNGGTQTPLVMAVGRFGTIQLGGTLGAGTIQVGAPIGGQQNQATPNSVQLINDGLITGTGRINTGVFRNRYLGKVRVDPGQSLVIDSTSEFITATGVTSFEPLSNYGTMEVFGNSQGQAQLEFVRAPAETTVTSSVRPFVNLPLAATEQTLPVPPAFTGGLISAQYANLRFGSGLQNQSMVAFTAGTNNITGRVVNLALDTLDSGDDGDAGDTTQMLVSGPGTTAVFGDDLSFGSAAHLNLVNGGNVVVLNQHSFTLSGDLSLTLSYTHPSKVTVSGDVGIGQGTTDLTLNLDSDVLHSLKHGDAFQLISFGGDIGNVNATDPNNPIPDLTQAPLFGDIDVSPNVFALYGLRPQIEFSNEGVYAIFLDPTKVGTPGGAGAIAPDFNGDGNVDLADFAIWKAHVGINSGASVLDGDADGDGDVDGADFLKWQRNVGKPMPWLGAGAGSGLANVPEPTSLVMLACGGALALAFGRGRSNR